MASSAPPSKESADLNMMNDEKFARIYVTDEKAAELLNNGRTVMNKPPFHACALGTFSYSSGIHRIRLRIEKGTAHLAIRSRNVPPTPDEYRWGHYGYSPSTYGWGRGCSHILDGQCYPSGETDVIPGVGLYTITINCDERRLHIINEDTRKQDEIEVDMSRAPFPWCLFVALCRAGAQVSLI